MKTVRYAILCALLALGASGCEHRSSDAKPVAPAGASSVGAVVPPSAYNQQARDAAALAAQKEAATKTPGKTAP